MTPMIEVRGVVVALGGVRVLDGVDLAVRAGELVALVGPNGAGKSTLLAVLAGDQVPDAGLVRLDATPLREIRLRELARRRAVLTQEVRLSFPFEVADVVRMGRSPWRGTPAEDRDDEAAAAAMAAAEVGSLAARRFPTLSGGEKARASFARVLAQEPRLLLLDEPTAALDIRHQEAVLGEVRRWVAGGAAAVVVLHDLSLAAAHADRVVVLDGGRVRGDGPARDVLTGPLLSEVYGHPIEVVARPNSDELVVLPLRGKRG